MPDSHNDIEWSLVTIVDKSRLYLSLGVSVDTTVDVDNVVAVDDVVVAAVAVDDAADDAENLTAHTVVDSTDMHHQN